jgi:hypothetical protein
MPDPDNDPDAGKFLPLKTSFIFLFAKSLPYF